MEEFQFCFLDLKILEEFSVPFLGLKFRRIFSSISRLNISEKFSVPFSRLKISGELLVLFFVIFLSI